MKTKTLAPFPKNSNPFNHDAFNMGTKMGKNCIIMHSNHDDEECNYIIICNTETGERTQVYLNNSETPSPAENVMNIFNKIHENINVTEDMLCENIDELAGHEMVMSGYIQMVL